MKKRIGIWIRVSTEYQAQQTDSPEIHENRARKHAELHGWDVVEVYDLSGVSGKDVLSHPEAKRMLRDIKTKHIDSLVFSKLARLARNNIQLLEIAKIFESCNADLVSLDEAIDTSTPAGRFFFSMISALAEWEREEIVSRVNASIKARAEVGKPLGGAAPFGYRWNDDTLKIDPKEAPIRKLMFELFLEHGNRKAVCDELNKRGHHTRKGKPFSGTTMYRMLTDPIAKGLRRVNYSKSKGEGKSWELKPEEDWNYVQIEPIVSEQLWKAVNDLIEKQQETKGPNQHKTRHLFTDYLFCHCGGKMTFIKSLKKYRCKACYAKITDETLTKVYVEELKAYTFRVDELSQDIQGNKDHHQEIDGKIAAITAEHTELKKKEASIIDLHSLGKVSTESFDEYYTPIHEQLTRLNKERVNLERQKERFAVDEKTVDEIIGDAQSLYERFPSLPKKSQRKIIEMTVIRIEVGTDTIDLDLHHISPLSKRVGVSDQNHKDSY